MSKNKSKQKYPGDVVQAAEEWFDKLDIRVVNDLAISRVLLERNTNIINNQAAALDYLRYVVQAGPPPMPADMAAHESLRAHAVLVAAIAILMLERIYLELPEEKCDCPACQLRELIESIEASGGKVTVLDGLTSVDEEIAKLLNGLGNAPSGKTH